MKGEKVGKRSKGWEEREKDGERKESTAKLNSVHFFICFLFLIK